MGVSMRAVSLVIIGLLVVLAYPSAAYGYIDPGAGSLFLQFLLGGLAGVYALGILFRQRIARFFRRSKKKEDGEPSIPTERKPE